jgi:hypothetical protein
MAKNVPPMAWTSHMGRVGHDEDPPTCRRGEYWAVPAEASIRRTLGRVDPEALTGAIGAWLTDRDRPDQRRRAVAVDGKTLRGAVLAQREVDGALGEVPGFAPLLAPLDLAGAVVTADALHTHREHADWLVALKQADYLLVVKGNQPTLLDRCAGLAWHRVPVADRTRDQAP